MFSLNQVNLNELDVTSGSITELEPALLSIQEPITRAYITTGTSQMACLQFRYLGPTLTRVAAASGTELHQIGLQLRRQNPCNLLYVMWRIHPIQEIVIQTKRNPGKSESKDCKNMSYDTLLRVPFRPFRFGEMHELMAEVKTNTDDTGEVRCWVDLQEVVRVNISAEFMRAVNGPPGIRSDNGQYNFRFFTAT